MQPKHVDAHGYGIESAHMRGGDWTTAHDAVLRVLAADVKSAGLRAEAEYHGLLDGCLPAGVIGPSIDLYGLFASCSSPSASRRAGASRRGCGAACRAS